MDRSNIKVKSYAVIRKGSAILVNEVRESDGSLKGFRIPGGHVEFGETGLETIHREIMEEIKAPLANVTRIDVLENHFVYNGKPGHEVIFLHKADFDDASFYERETIQAFEDDGTAFTLFWLDLSKNLPEGTDIFPSGLRAMLA